jgi:SOS response regulatory protein OraA/RecX
MQYKEALKKVAAYCAKAERCKQDVINYLKKLDIDDDSIQQIIQILEKENFSRGGILQLKIKQPIGLTE